MPKLQDFSFSSPSSSSARTPRNHFLSFFHLRGVCRRRPPHPPPPPLTQPAQSICSSSECRLLPSLFPSSSLFDVQSASSLFLPSLAAPVALPNHFTRNEITEADDDGRSGFEIFGEISKLRWGTFMFGDRPRWVVQNSIG